MSKEISSGAYTGHLEHFANQSDNVFVYIIDEAEDESLIGKGITFVIGIDLGESEYV